MQGKYKVDLVVYEQMPFETNAEDTYDYEQQLILKVHIMSTLNWGEL
jgi:hypothetical protein